VSRRSAESAARPGSGAARFPVDSQAMSAARPVAARRVAARRGPWLAGAAGLLLIGCTQSQLQRVPDPPPDPIDNRVRVSGRFCTEDPQAVEFPVKILFIVDTSGSMAITDPPIPTDANYTGRTRAVIDVVNALAGVRGVEIGLITFESAVNDLTRGFRPNLTAPDVAALTQAAANLGSSAAQTNYLGALEAAYQVLVDDLSRADELARARSRYTVIFLSDGLPNPPVPRDELLEVVEDIQELERERRLVELKLHTIYLSGSTPPQFQQEPIDLLKDMADTGRGTFRNIGNGERINFLDIGFTAFRRVFSMSSFLLSNLNARPIPDVIGATDSDGDALTDLEEELLGTDPGLADTDGDGFSDRLEQRLRTAGFDPLDPLDADCAVTPTDDFNRRDDDGDGLLNCEERFLGTNQRLFDSDADGLGDRFEVQEGLSAVDDDYFGDLDKDGALNGFEVRDRSDPRVDDAADFRALHQVYAIKEIGIRDSRTCYEFRVDEVRLAPTRAVGGRERGWNTLLIGFGQKPGDDPGDFGEFRLACARARFVLDTNEKRPANGRLELPEDAFRPATELDLERDCVEP
jgi:hypothetical protein